MERALTATDLAKTYGDGVWALDGATFEVGYGEIFACLGRDGTGKTTTVRILTDNNPVEPYRRDGAGGGARRPRRTRAVKRPIGVTMPEEAALDPEMPGREHLELGADTPRCICCQIGRARHCPTCGSEVLPPSSPTALPAPRKPIPKRTPGAKRRTVRVRDHPTA